MKIEDKRGGYGLRGDLVDLERDQKSCPQCGLELFEYGEKDDFGETEFLDACAHLRFVVRGFGQERMFCSYGNWDSREFERELAEKMGWKPSKPGKVEEEMEIMMIEAKRKGYWKDPQERAIDSYGEDDEFDDRKEYARCRKAMAKFKGKKVNWLRRADPHGGCLVGSPVEFVLMGFQVQPSKMLKLVKSKKGDEYSLMKGNKPIFTPRGNPVTHNSYWLMKQVMRDLSRLEDFEPCELSETSMIATEIDCLRKGRDTVGEDFERILLSDIALRTCAGPEEAFQLSKLGFLVTYLEGLGLQHPRWPQTLSPDQVREWMVSSGKEAEFKRFASVLSEKYMKDYAITRKCTVVNARNIHGSALLGMMLAHYHCRPDQYAEALNACNCLDAEIWGGVSKEEQEEAYYSVEAEAKILTAYSSHN